VRLTVFVDQYPALSETFVLAEVACLAQLGHAVRVESAAWAEVKTTDPPRVPVACIDEDSLARRFVDLAWLLARHPIGCIRDLIAQSRWRREEPVRPLRVIAPVARRVNRWRTEHLHAHFAAGAALDAMRIGHLLGLPWSVTAHAYDIYRSPANLAEKLREAKVACAVSEYSARDLRELGGPDANVQIVKMGVDHEYFRRSRPLPCDRTVIAVGRLVEKKGFRHLLAAIGLLTSSAAPVERLIVVGDGPLRRDLEDRARALGIANIVEWAGARGADYVREVLEQADLLAIPSVPAADGDRDVLPLVAGEALAMEIPVVASDFVGLPEVVRPPWGRLVAPGDEVELASAIRDLLSLDRAARVSAGQAGREFVIRTRDQRAEAANLIALISGD